MSRGYEMALIVDTQEDVDETVKRYEALLADQGLTDEQRVRTFLLRALGRPASDIDLQRATSFLRDTEAGFGRAEAWARYCHAVFASSEFMFRS